MVNKEVAEKLREMKDNWKQRLETADFNPIEANYEDVEDKQTVYELGRLDQALSTLDALEIQDEDLDSI